MQTTTNYGFSIAEGSDSVNLLTQLYPNFTSLDGILLPIQNNGTTPATHTKAGTVHQLVRTTTGCSVLRFVATGNYNAGDTFTVDGASVTATSCNGQSLSAGAFVINQSVMAILNGAVLTVLAGGSSSSDASDINYDNTSSGLSATNVQTAIDEVYGDIPTGFPATAITYDNTSSGLVATNVQNAIDEIAQSSGGSDHGVYELWVNPSPTADFSAQTLTIADSDPSSVDEIIIAVSLYASAGSACFWIGFDKYSFDGNNHDLSICTQVGGNVAMVSRSVAITTTATGFSIAIGSADAGGNQRLVPIRIMKIIHNN